MISGYDYHVGDRVRALGCNWFNVQTEDTGTVVFVFDYSNVGVQWDENIGGHSCDGHGKQGYCSWEVPYSIEILHEQEGIKENHLLVLDSDCDLI